MDANSNREQSMEEILASIKRVIAEDTRSAAPAAARSRSGPAVQAAPMPEADDEEDVLELDHVVGEESLISDDVAAATRQRLAALSAATNGAASPAPGGDGALEAVVRDMLRPMLKEWLDQRLPEIIEDMVAREIARITGRSF